MSLYPVLRPLAFALDAETAHRATIAALKLTPARRPPTFPPSLHTRVAGLDFPTPVGLAAGFDKDAEVPEQMLGLGFGFVEIGTVTSRPQGRKSGNLGCFRLTEDRAVINRMGFNNMGQPSAFDRLQYCTHVSGVIGVNIGASKDSADRIADYVAGVRAMSSVARYLTINISSPNTPGLRQLQDEGALNALLSAVSEARSPKGPPIFLKVAPDLGEGEPDQIVRVVANHAVDAIIVANSPFLGPLKSRYAIEAGGLSDEQLKGLALRHFATARQRRRSR
jgi:dihydroorotate dehydrogenase